MCQAMKSFQISMIFRRSVSTLTPCQTGLTGQKQKNQGARRVSYKPVKSFSHEDMKIYRER